MIGSTFGHYQQGYRFGVLALRLAARFRSAAARAWAGVPIYGHAAHWARPLAESYAGGIQTYDAGLQSGELQYAGYSLMSAC